MTTLAVSKSIMAADTQLTDDDGCVMYRVQKIDRLEDGSLVGGAGEWDRVYAYIQWLKLGNKEIPPPKLKGSTVVRLTPDGVIWFNEGQGFYPLLNKDNVAVGTGAQAAMALMEQGASAVDAIKVVQGLDMNTSSPVQMLELHPSPKTPRNRKSSNPKAVRTASLDQDT